MYKATAALNTSAPSTFVALIHLLHVPTYTLYITNLFAVHTENVVKAIKSMYYKYVCTKAASQDYQSTLPDSKSISGTVGKIYCR